MSDSTKHLVMTSVDSVDGGLINVQPNEGDIPLTSCAIDRKLEPSCPPRYDFVLLKNLTFSDGHIKYSIGDLSYVNPLWKTKFQYFSSLETYLNFIDIPCVIKHAGKYKYILCIDFMKSNSDQNLKIIVQRNDSM